VDVFTHQTPIAALGLDAPPGPQIELVVDDRRAARFKHDTEILSPLSMSKPPLTKLHKFLAGVNEPVHVERAEIVAPQEDRHSIRIAPAAEIVVHLLEAQYPHLAAIQYDTIVAVHLGQQRAGFLTALGAPSGLGRLLALRLLRVSRLLEHARERA